MGHTWGMVHRTITGMSGLPRTLRTCHLPAEMFAASRSLWTGFFLTRKGSQVQTLSRPPPLWLVSALSAPGRQHSSRAAAARRPQSAPPPQPLGPPEPPTPRASGPPTPPRSAPTPPRGAPTSATPRGEPAPPPVLAQRLFVLGEVETCDGVVGDVALHPLQPRRHRGDDLDRFL